MNWAAIVQLCRKIFVWITVCWRQQIIYGQDTYALTVRYKSNLYVKLYLYVYNLSLNLRCMKQRILRSWVNNFEVQNKKGMKHIGTELENIKVFQKILILCNLVVVYNLSNLNTFLEHISYSWIACFGWKKNNKYQWV